MGSLKDESRTSEVAIANLVADIAHVFVSLASALTTASHFSVQVASSAYEDEFSRFKLWAGNIAAHRKGTRSLEYRLRDAAHLKTETNNLFRALCDTLSNALAIVQGEKVPWDQLSNPDSEHTYESDSDADLQGITELKQLYESSKIIITSLFRLSMSIRNPALDSQSKSTISIDKSFYEQHDIQHVREKFPDSPIYLTERLGRAISARRQYLSYREEHHQKLAKNIEKIGFEKTVTEFTTNSTKATALPSLDRSNSLNMLDEADDTVSQTSYATSVNATIRVPALPKEAQSQEFFECPLCFLLVSIHSAAAWKQHVYRDLHPYCCTYEQFATADRLYDSRKTWFAHELLAHQTLWQCIEGCAKTFHAEVSFEDHVRNDHLDLASKDILPPLKKTSEKRATFAEQGQCNLCRKSMSFRMLQRHLGNHLQQLALFALPPNLDDTENDPNEKQGSMNVGKNRDEEVSDASDGSDADENHDAWQLKSSTDDKSDAWQQIQMIRMKWDSSIRERCEAFITQPPHEEKDREDRYDVLKEIILREISDKLVFHGNPQDIILQKRELVNEVNAVVIQIHHVTKMYPVTSDNIEDSSLQSKLDRISDDLQASVSEDFSYTTVSDPPANQEGVSTNTELLSMGVQFTDPPSSYEPITTSYEKTTGERIVEILPTYPEYKYARLLWPRFEAYLAHPHPEEELQVLEKERFCEALEQCKSELRQADDGQDINRSARTSAVIHELDRISIMLNFQI